MKAHLILPYAWVNCADLETCDEHIHIVDTAENLNSYPVEWVETLIGNCKIKTDTIIFYNTSGEIHNENGPATIQSHGTCEWYQNGRRHRENGPAITHSSGSREWWVNGELHRENAPAIESSDGTEEWWFRDKLHREDGPAITHSDNTMLWYRHGRLHREGAPAIIHPNGNKEWCVNGIMQTQPENSENFLAPQHEKKIHPA